MGELKDAGNSTTLSHYLKFLSDTGLLSGLEKFSGKVIRKRSSIPKFQVFNNSLLSAQAHLSFSEMASNPKEWGRLVESSVGSHLLNHSISERYQLSYWREGNYEVDFIIQRGEKIIAIEVKSGKKAENAGITVFAEKFKVNRCLLVGTGGLGIEDFLRINPATLF
jgi:predicted AAA+ superfamily ATPase